jgi:hypothetical protein
MLRRTAFERFKRLRARGQFHVALRRAMLMPREAVALLFLAQGPIV